MWCAATACSAAPADSTTLRQLSDATAIDEAFLIECPYFVDDAADVSVASSPQYGDALLSDYGAPLFRRSSLE